MARIRILQAISGMDFSWRRGELVDLPDDVAAQWADGVRAELVDQDPPPPPAAAAPVVVGEHGPETSPPDPEDPEDPDGGDGPSLFDPADHNVGEVLDYLDGVGEEEAMRVLQLEENAEQPRKGIVGQRGSILERAEANDTRERAAEVSRGGGRGDGIETR